MYNKIMFIEMKSLQIKICAVRLNYFFIREGKVTHDAKERNYLPGPGMHPHIWGGSKLREEFGYKIEGNDIGECWGISAHPNGDAS